MNSCEKSLHIPRRLPDEVAEAFVRDARCKMQDASLISLTSSAVQWTGDNCCIDVACAQLGPTYVVYNYSSLSSAAIGAILSQIVHLALAARPAKFALA